MGHTVAKVLPQVFWMGRTVDNILPQVFWMGHAVAKVLPQVFWMGHTVDKVLPQVFWMGRSVTYLWYASVEAPPNHLKAAESAEKKQRGTPKQKGGRYR